MPMKFSTEETDGKNLFRSESSSSDSLLCDKKLAEIGNENENQFAKMGRGNGDGNDLKDEDFDSSNPTENPFAGSAENSRWWYSVWSGLLNKAWAVLETRSPCGADCRPRRLTRWRWNAALRRAVTADPMRKLKEHLLRCQWTSSSSSNDPVIWLLGVQYVLPQKDDLPSDHEPHQDFMADLSSRIWITYRKGFEVIGPKKLATDVGWGCMIRSGQMLLAQALVCHKLGRSWRRSSNTPHSLRMYLEILQLFGDSSSSTSPFSIHNIVALGGPYGLVAGSWLGPYTMCCVLEALAYSHRNKTSEFEFPMALHVVSGDGDGERGGAPCICIDAVQQLCSNWSPGKQSALLLLVPLVLGLNKVNPKYLPLLAKTFSFPQSVGIIGGKPGTSTYLVGVQGDRVLYLDPHQVQQTQLISPDNTGAETSSYHCSNVRHMSLSSIDPSLALGFYCRNQDDFDDLCQRALELERQSDGTPMFSVVQSSDNLVTSIEGPSSKTYMDKEPVYSHVDNISSEEGWQLL